MRFRPNISLRKPLVGAVISAILVISILGIYGSTLDGEFIWDDVMLIRDNPSMKSLSGAFHASFGDFWGQQIGHPSIANGIGAPPKAHMPSSGYFRPAVTLLNGITYHLWGADPVPYRITNLLLHLITSLLFLLLLLRLGLSNWASFVGVGLFALHPVQTEPVAFISGRPDLLAALFCLVTIHLIVLQRTVAERKWQAVAGGLALVAYVGALASKEVALALPFVVLVMAHLRLLPQRAASEEEAIAPSSAQPHKGTVGMGKRAQFGRYWVIFGLMALTAFFLSWRFFWGMVPVERLHVPVEGVAVGAFNFTALYFRLLLLPVGQRVLYDGLDFLSLSGWTLLGIIVWGMGVFTLWRWHSKLRLETLGLVWFLSFILPVLHVIPIPVVAAERFLYLPSMGFAIMVASLVSRLEGTQSPSVVKRWVPLPDRRVLVAGCLGCLLCLYLLSGARAVVWRDELSLWGTEIGRPDPGFKVYQNLGVALAEKGRDGEAFAASMQAWKLHPGHPMVFRNLVRLGLGAEPEGPGKGLSSEALGRAKRDLLSPQIQAQALRLWIGPLNAAGYRWLSQVVGQMVRASQGEWQGQDDGPK